MTITDEEILSGLHMASEALNASAPIKGDGDVNVPRAAWWLGKLSRAVRDRIDAGQPTSESVKPQTAAEPTS